MPKEDGNKVGNVEGEYSRPQAAEAISHYDKVLAPKQAQIDKIKGEMSEPWNHNRDQFNMPKRAIKLVLALRKIDDEAKQQHEIDAIYDALAAEGFERSKDLVSMMEDGSDLPPGLDDDDFEATPEELAAQTSRRPSAKTEPEVEAVH